MNYRLGRILASVAVLALSAPLAAQPGNAPVTAATSAETEAEKLQALFRDSDEANLKRNPLFALFRGDMRYSDQFGDFVSDAYFAAEKAAAEADLKALQAIDRSKLSSADQLSYDVFRWQRTSDLKGYEPALLKASILRPIDHFNGLHQFVPDILSGQSVG